MMGDYRLLVTGSRSMASWRPVYQTLWGWLSYLSCIDGAQRLVVVHGDAVEGVDRHARQFVEWMESVGRGALIAQDPFPADWDGPCDLSSGLCQLEHRRASRFVTSDSYCPTAGFRRNQTMVDSGVHSYVALTDRPLPKSRGTWNCVQRCERAGVPGEHIEMRIPDGRAVDIDAALRARPGGL